MKMKMILAALTEAKSPFWRRIKYSLFQQRMGTASSSAPAKVGRTRDDKETLTPFPAIV